MLENLICVGGDDDGSFYCQPQLDGLKPKRSSLKRGLPLCEKILLDFQAVGACCDNQTSSHRLSNSLIKGLVYLKGQSREKKVGAVPIQQ